MKSRMRSSLCSCCTLGIARMHTGTNSQRDGINRRAVSNAEADLTTMSCAPVLWYPLIFVAPLACCYFFGVRNDESIATCGLGCLFARSCGCRHGSRQEGRKG